MKRLLLVVALVPALALAQEKQEKAAGTSGDPMAGWVPPKVKSEAKDKQEIQALFRGMETAARTGDLDAAAALVDFPVTMLTDDSKGQASGEAWSREQWTQVMKPFYDKPMKDVKVTHKPTIFLMSDSLASVDDVSTMTQGGKSMTTRSSMLLVRRDGKWRVKAMAEGGWGDMMASSAGTAASGQGDSTSGSAGSGSSGGAAERPGAEKGDTGAQTPKSTEPPERTTK